MSTPNKWGVLVDVEKVEIIPPTNKAQATIKLAQFEGYWFGAFSIEIFGDDEGEGYSSYPSIKSRYFPSRQECLQYYKREMKEYLKRWQFHSHSLIKIKKKIIAKLMQMSLF